MPAYDTRINPLITFIIPSIGRDTLTRTIKSLEDQTITNWSAIIIFDNIPPTILNSDPRIIIIKSPKLGEGRNSGGNVRNYGMEFVTTPWIAFVDDDDTLSSNYIELFYKEIEAYPSIDVVIMRMQYDNKIIPSLKTTNINIDDVGISFIMRTSIKNTGLKFIPSKVEDFKYLQLMKNNGYKLMISPYITYYVHNTNNAVYNPVLGNRAIIDINGIESFSRNLSIKMVEHLQIICMICVILILIYIGLSQLKLINLM